MTKQELKQSILDNLEQDNFSVDELKGLINQYKVINRVITITDATENVCDILKVDIEELKSDKRNYELVKARGFIYMYFREVLDKYFTVDYIASFFNRNHSTVVHSLKRIKSDHEQNYRGCRDEFEIFLKQMGAIQ